MDPRFPIGPFLFTPSPGPDRRAAGVAAIGRLPAELRAAVSALPADRLDRPYREGGWTARQVVHHVADSHMNAYIRFKLTLTETNPPLKPYEEQIWAELVDGKTGDPAVSLGILDGVHHRLHRLLSTLGPADFARTAHHPQHGTVTLDWLLQTYAWHGRHHTAHVVMVGGR
jgi:DinB superfamily